MRFGDYEQLLPDIRLGRLEKVLRVEFPGLDPEATFVTFIQPEIEGVLPAKAVLAVMSVHPKHPDFTIMTPGVTNLESYRGADYEWEHFVGKVDPALQILRLVTADHIRKINSLKELLN